MELYAIEIRERDLALITLLNQGVTPKVESKPTYFVFDAEWNSEVPNQILSQDAINWIHSNSESVHIQKLVAQE